MVNPSADRVTMVPRRTRAQARLMIRSCTMLFFLAACDGGSTMPSCTVDDDCPDGQFCGADLRCDLECATDTDCPGERCDTARGRCVGRDSDAGHEDAGDDAGSPCSDADGDGHVSIACDGDDCDDGDPDRFPSNPEVCNLAAPRHDEDCDPTTFGDRDNDGDTYVDARCCNEDEGGGERCGNDCDDSAEDTHPDTADTCDGYDTDCDGVIDDGTQVAGCADLDHDLHGDPDAAMMACPGSPDFATVCDDCDDTNAARYAGRSETCDHIDNDCNGIVDDGLGVDYFADCDNDDRGAGAAVTLCPADPIPECMGNPYVTTAGDCDDMCATCEPGGTEVCDGRDNDCAGGVDNGSLPGIGVSCMVMGAVGECALGTSTCEAGVQQCRGPSPRPETCGDGRDFDCDGAADEEGTCVGSSSCSENTCGFPGEYLDCSACRRVTCDPRVDATYTQDAWTFCGGSFVIGTSRLAWCGDNNCYLQFGPFVGLPIGTYEVTLDAHGNNGWFHVFDWDVNFPDGGGSFISAGPGGALAPVDIPNGRRYAIAGDDMRNLVTLRFRVNNSCVRTEFRVFYRGATSGLSTCTGTSAAFAVNSRRVVRVSP
jgi:hypothetical protein